MSTRSEAFVSDNQARDTVAQGELALGARPLCLVLGHWTKKSAVS
jgi:hypothetical protein